MGKFYKILLNTSLLMILITSFGCTDTSNDNPLPPLPTKTVFIADSTQPEPATVITELPEEIPSSNPEPTHTATREPLTLFTADPLPNDLFIQEKIGVIPISQDANAPFWLGPAEEAPEGEVYQTSTWVYALAAPFPTLIDDVSLSDLQAFWTGDSIKGMESVSALYVPETLARILDLRWGAHGPSVFPVAGVFPTTTQIWDENAWVILPFENLEPQLKVISVDEISPLFKDFNPAHYPLTLAFKLVLNPSDHDKYSQEEIQLVIDMVKPTNRDPQKMTTLVMTGVTALVRATAYKMEVHGVLYPGEKIVHWLSEADLTHISNEVSFYEKCPFPDPNTRSLFFCSDPKYIELFDYIGADIIELTGNHNNDVLYVYGDYVVPYNLELYLERGLVYYGGGLDLEDAMTPRIVTHHGNQIAFIGCNASGPDFAWATQYSGGAARCGDYQWMVDEISRLKDEGVIPIATLQYYEDYYNYAESHHIRDFGLLARAGAAIVNGSQAHRPKGMAFENDSFIDYGLGNLFFDQMGVLDMYGNQVLQTRWEIIQRHTIYDGQHISTELLTAMLEDYAQPRPMTQEERQVFLEELFTASGWISR